MRCGSWTFCRAGDGPEDKVWTYDNDRSQVSAGRMVCLPATRTPAPSPQNFFPLKAAKRNREIMKAPDILLEE